jgi:hypothetical protein
MALVFVATLALLPAPPAGATTRRRDVYFLGDSVMQGAPDQLRARLPGWNVTVDTFVGRMLEAGLDALRAHRAEIHDAVVIHLGDQVQRLSSIDQTIDEAMHILGGVDEVVWLNVHNHQPYRDEVNRALDRAAERWPNLVVLDWDSVANANPGATYHDGTHLTPFGRNLYADVATGELWRWADPDARCASASGPKPQPSPASGRGYWLLSTEGRVYPFDLPFLGDLAARGIAARAVSMAATPSGNGYWILTSDGHVHAFGDAVDAGSVAGMRLNGGVREIVAAPNGGYWILAVDGGVFSFGGAPFLGSTGGMPLNAPIVTMTADPDGSGYWLVGGDGGVFSFDAPFHGSTGNVRLVSPIAAMAMSAHGYQLLGGDGGVFSFDAPYVGSLPGLGFCHPRASGVATTATGGGYWVTTPEGSIYSFGDALFHGGSPDITPGARIVSITAA